VAPSTPGEGRGSSHRRRGRREEDGPDPPVLPPSTTSQKRAATVPGVHGFTETFPANSRIF